MTLTLRPQGRGNWSTITATFLGQRAQPLLFQVGGTLVLAGITFRICKVEA